MSGRSQYIVHIPNTETAYNQSHSKMIHSNNSTLPFSKQKHFKIKSAASREFDAYESYYGVNNSEDYAIRKEHYLAEDYLFKSRLKCQPLSNSKPKNKEQKYTKTVKPVQCFASRSYPNSAQHKTSTPIKNIFIRVADNKPKEKVVIPNDVRMDWDNYHRLDVIHKFIDDLELDYPSLCTTGSIGKSLEGRDLKVLKISNSDSSNAGVWIDAGIHAREWIAPAVNTYVADHIAKNFDNMPKSVRNKDWYFLPVLNPDGYEYSHTTKRMWRKNKACVRNQLYGVDLNRNFSLAWGGLGSSDEPQHAFYRGPAPFSEPESSAMRDIFLHSGIKFQVYLTLHSFGQVIIMPFAHSSELAQDYIRLLEGATVMSKAIYETNGNTYKVGISKDVMYQASGTSNDWSHGAVGIPFCYLIELRSKKHKFKVPKEEIAETGAEILNCIIALMEFIDNYNKPKTENKESESELKSETISSNIVESIEEEKTEKSKCYKLEHAQTDLTSDSDIDFYEHTEKVESPVAGFHLDQQDSEDTDSHTRCVLQMMFLNNKRKFEARRDKPSMQNRFSVFLKRLNKTKDKIQKSRSGCDHNMPSGDHCQKGTPMFNGNSQSHLTAINIWKELNSTMDVMVEGQRINQVAAMLKERDISYSVEVPDVHAIYEKELPDRKKTLSWAINSPSPSYIAEMDWTNYHRLDTIYEFMDNLVKEYPYLCHVSVIGRTEEGRDIKLLKISNGNKGNESVWLDGTIHAREWISPAVVTYIADQLVRNFSDYPSSVTSKDWFILPVMNPDGYEYTHTSDRMWRKNRARYGECIGVDLNRNWSHGWGEKGEEGSSDDPGNIFFRGSKPFSEAETAAVKHTILQSTTTFKVFLSLHSYGEAIIFPWGCTSEPCPDYVMLLEGGTAISKAIYETSGHTYKVGSTKDLMYYACGTSTDWSYAVAKIPFSYMIELRAKEHRFLLPKEEIISTAKEVHGGIMRLLDFVDERM